jgi:hypothetical protein
VFNVRGEERGYIQNNHVYYSDGYELGGLEDVRNEVSRGYYSGITCAAAAILFGAD